MYKDTEVAVRSAWMRVICRMCVVKMKGKPSCVELRWSLFAVSTTTTTTTTTTYFVLISPNYLPEATAG